MRQQDIVELIGGFVSVGLVGAILGRLGVVYGWPRETGTIVVAGFSGFAMQQLARRITRRRKSQH